MDRSLTRWSGDDDEHALAPRERQELEQALNLRGKERLEAILLSSNPSALTQALAPSEMFYTYGELDEEDQRMLLHLASGEQVDFLLDLDLWEGDEITPERAQGWIERLVLAGSDQAVRWVMRADSELVVTVLRELIVVVEGAVGSQAVLAEVQDVLPPFTAEGVYYVFFRFKGSERLLKTLLIQVASEDLEYYLALLADVIALTRTEAEEEARERRWGRLRDEGFLPPEEAYEIYRWPSQRELKLEERAEAERRARDEEGAQHGSTALALAGPAGALDAAISGLIHDELIELSRSLAMAGARILTADNLPPGELDSHRKALGKALAFVGLGLDRAAEGDAQRARGALREQGALTLFRLGYAEVTELSRRALALKRQGWLRHQVGLGLDLLGEPLSDVVEALAAPRPRYPARALDHERKDRDFQKVEDLVRCAEILDHAEAMRRLFIDGLGLDLAPAEVFDLTGCIPSRAAELTLGLILRTAVGNLVLEGGLRFAPIPSAQLPILIRRIQAEAASDILEGPLRGEVFEALKERLEEPSESELNHVAELVDANLSELVADLSGIDISEPVDPRFVGAVVIRHD